MVQYIATNRDGEQSLTVFGTNWQKPVAGTHPNFGAILEYVTRTPESEHDEEYVRGLVDPTVGIGKALQEHFGDRMTFDLHHLYLDGLKVEGPLVNLIKQRMLAADQDWLRFAKFLTNLERNPSRHAQQAVWKWVEANGLTVTEDGRFLGYKAVLENGLSSSSGPMNYVNGVLLNGGADCQVPHVIGSVISKRRADVDDTPGGGCSVGLHVGTEEYARGFAPRLMTVAVDPADVVSAPDRDLSWKIRVCKYEVISLADPTQFASTSYDVNPDPEVEEALDEIVDDEVEEETLVEPEKGTGLLGRVVLRDWANVNPGLKAELEDRLPNGDFRLGNTAVARKYSDITTESSVRRYRKAL